MEVIIICIKYSKELVKTVLLFNQIFQKMRSLSMKSKLLLKLFILLAMLSIVVSAYADVRSPERTQGLIVDPSQGAYELVSLKGPGTFVSAQITKQGGTNDLTFVNLDIDGKNVVNVSIAALKNWGLTQNNPYGLVLLQSTGDLKTFTIGFPYPLHFKSELKLSVNVNEDDVVQILTNVIHGKWIVTFR